MTVISLLSVSICNLEIEGLVWFDSLIWCQHGLSTFSATRKQLLTLDRWLCCPQPNTSQMNHFAKSLCSHRNLIMMVEISSCIIQLIALCTSKHIAISHNNVRPPSSLFVDLEFCAGCWEVDRISCHALPGCQSCFSRKSIADFIPRYSWSQYREPVVGQCRGA